MFRFGITSRSLCSTKFLEVLLLLITLCRKVSGQELNQILNIFSSCYTDLIFSNSVYDIPPPEYPVLVSTPQENFSVTPPTIRVNESLEFGFQLLDKDLALPKYESYNSTFPQIITVRLNCVALVILDANLKEDIRSAVRNRHNWIHFTRYPDNEYLELAWPVITTVMTNLPLTLSKPITMVLPIASSSQRVVILNNESGILNYLCIFILRSQRC